MDQKEADANGLALGSWEARATRDTKSFGYGFDAAILADRALRSISVVFVLPLPPSKPCLSSSSFSEVPSFSGVLRCLCWQYQCPACFNEDEFNYVKSAGHILKPPSSNLWGGLTNLLAAGALRRYLHTCRQGCTGTVRWHMGAVGSTRVSSVVDRARTRLKILPKFVHRWNYGYNQYPCHLASATQHYACYSVNNPLCRSGHLDRALE